MNETLCRALLQARLSEEDVAARLQVDPKTVRRWLEGRVPYLRYRWALAAMVGLDETDLWPQLRSNGSRPDEVQTIYPHLDVVPEEVWLHLFGSAEHEIGILADTAQPIVELPRVMAVLTAKVAAGVRARICMRDPESIASSRFGTSIEEQRVAIHEAISVLGEVRESGPLELRLYRPILYNSIWYNDSELLVGQHAFGIREKHEPVIKLDRSQGRAVANMYLSSFADVWISAICMD